MDVPENNIELDFGKKIAHSLVVIATALANMESQEHWILSYNGGKDSCVMFFLTQSLLSKSGNDPILTYLQENGFDKQLAEINSIKESLKFSWRYAYFEYKQEEEFKEVLEYCSDIEAEYGINIEKYHNKIKEDLETLVRDESVSTILIGNRNTDPYSASLKHVENSSPGWPDFTRIHPIIDWDYHEVWRFINFFKFKVPCLYEQGYTSLGRVHNTRKNPHLQKPSSGEGPAEYYPAWMLKDASKERESRVK